MSTETATPTKPSGIPWLGDIPAHWEVKRLKDIADVRFSNVNKKSEEGERPVRLCNYTDVYYGHRLDGSQEYMQATASAHEIARFKLYAGDVLITKDSESPIDIAVSAMVVEHVPDLLCGYHLAIVRANKHEMDGAFLHWQFVSDQVREQYYPLANGITRFALGQSEIGSGRFLVPPLPEQRAIAAFLDERTARIDGLIARKQRLVALLREKRQALITRAVTRGLDPKVKLKESGVPWLGAVPEGWDVVRLKKIAIKITKGTTPTTEGGGFVDEGEIRFIKVESIGDRMNIIDEMCARIDEAMNTALSRSQLQESDVLVSIAGAIGRIGLVPKSALPANTNQAVGIVRVNKSIALPEWVALALQCHAAQEQFALDNVQSAQANLSLGDLGNTWITLPPVIQQQVIIAKVNQQTTLIDALIAKVEAAVERLVEYRVALISAAVTGKVRVP
jgi:type I restriction enzyme S subunit